MKDDYKAIENILYSLKFLFFWYYYDAISIKNSIKNFAVYKWSTGTNSGLTLQFIISTGTNPNQYELGFYINQKMINLGRRYGTNLSNWESIWTIS